MLFAFAVILLGASFFLSALLSREIWLLCRDKQKSRSLRRQKKGEVYGCTGC